MSRDALTAASKTAATAKLNSLTKAFLSSCMGGTGPAVCNFYYWFTMDWFTEYLMRFSITSVYQAAYKTICIQLDSGVSFGQNYMSLVGLNYDSKTKCLSGTMDLSTFLPSTNHALFYTI